MKFTAVLMSQVSLQTSRLTHACYHKMAEGHKGRLLCNAMNYKGYMSQMQSGVERHGSFQNGTLFDWTLDSPGLEPKSPVSQPWNG